MREASSSSTPCASHKAMVPKKDADGQVTTTLELKDVATTKLCFNSLNGRHRYVPSHV